jgi:hypothetical protein
MGKRLKHERTLLRLGTRYDNTDGLAASLRDWFGKTRTNRGGLLLRAHYDSLTGKVAATLDNVPQEQVSTGAGTVESSSGATTSASTNRSPLELGQTCTRPATCQPGTDPMLAIPGCEPASGSRARAAANGRSPHARGCPRATSSARSFSGAVVQERATTVSTDAHCSYVGGVLRQKGLAASPQYWPRPRHSSRSRQTTTGWTD